MGPERYSLTTGSYSTVYPRLTATAAAATPPPTQAGRSHGRSHEPSALFGYGGSSFRLVPRRRHFRTLGGLRAPDPKPFSFIVRLSVCFFVCLRKSAAEEASTALSLAYRGL